MRETQPDLILLDMEMPDICGLDVCDRLKATAETADIPIIIITSHVEPGITWHGLRHTWASWHVQSGTPLNVLQELGGWSSYDMVLRYAHLAPDHLAKYAGNVSSKSLHYR